MPDPKISNSKFNPCDLNVFRIAKSLNMDMFEYYNTYSEEQYWVHLIMSELDYDVTEKERENKKKNNK